VLDVCELLAVAVSAAQTSRRGVQQTDHEEVAHLLDHLVHKGQSGSSDELSLVVR
jgi:hypothetical protein